MKKLRDLLHKKRKLTLFLSIIAVSVLFVGFSLANDAFVAKFDGETIGIVKDKEVVESILQDIIMDMEKRLQKKVVISQEITFEELSSSKKSDISSETEIEERINEIIEVNVEAYAINADGNNLAYIDTEQAAKDVLRQLKEKYIVDVEKTEVKKVGFVEAVKIEKSTAPPSLIKEKEEALDYIMLGTDKERIYIVESGDTVWDISKEYGLTEEEMRKANPNVDLNRIKIGQELIVIAPEPLINVKTIETIKYEESIPYPTQYENSDVMYKDESKIKVHGSEGKKIVDAELEKINGIQTNKEIIKEEVLIEPEKRIVVRGTKERPKTMATRSFLMPARGRLTSSFGSRWGRQHEAIDVAMPTGTLIKAADAGTVTFAGTKGSYGKLVIISHENGYETRYAHNSSLLVKQGQKVYKSQTIAKSGNTGKSTGPHMHFEGRKNGVAVNPLNYVR
jgi:murein DD-endopeptidase MepM/ murein hydrolase activator NlpD